MITGSAPWIKPLLCDRCHKETKEVEMIQLEKDFDSAKVCTKCALDLVKKIESHRATHDAVGRRREIEIFQKFMGKYQYGYNDSTLLGIIIAVFLFIDLLIFTLSYLSKTL